MANKIETLFMGVGNAVEVCDAVCADSPVHNLRREDFKSSISCLLDGIERGGSEAKIVIPSVVALLNKINAGGASFWYLSPEGAICRETFPNGVLVGVVERMLL